MPPDLCTPYVQCWFYTNLDPFQGIWRINLLFLYALLHPMEPKMSFGAPSRFTHMERHTDANDTTYTFHTCFSDPPYPKLCTDLTRIYTVFGVKYGYLHVLSLPPLFFMTLTHVLTISPFGEGSFYTKSSSRPSYRINTYIHIHFNKYFNIKHPYCHPWTDIKHFAFILLSKSYVCL